MRLVCPGNDGTNQANVRSDANDTMANSRRHAWTICAPSHLGRPLAVCSGYLQLLIAAHIYGAGAASDEERGEG